MLMHRTFWLIQLLKVRTCAMTSLVCCSERSFSQAGIAVPALPLRTAFSNSESGLFLTFLLAKFAWGGLRDIPTGPSPLPCGPWHTWQYCWYTCSPLLLSPLAINSLFLLTIPGRYRSGSPTLRFTPLISFIDWGFVDSRRLSNVCLIFFVSREARGIELGKWRFYKFN